MLERQFTATVYIIDSDKVLLIYHKKLQKWLPPGGHMDPNETPPEAARREVREETGLEIEFIQQENVWIKHWNAASFERPYLCLLEEIPAYQSTPAHQHVDFVYLARPAGGIEVENLSETGGMRWFSLEEIEGMESDVDVFTETKEAIRSIFNQCTVQ